MTPGHATPPAPRANAACVVFPRGVNWFYEKLAERLAGELNSHGLGTDRCAAVDLCGGHRSPSPVALLLTPKECIASLPSPALADEFVAAVGRFPRRILVNYDCVHTDWFLGQFAVRKGFITEVVDVNMLPQTQAPSLCGVPYRWVPESFTAAERSALGPRTGNRPLPWAVVGHKTAPRAALVEALVSGIGPGGFAFLPPHRPYREGTGTLSEASLERVLKQSDLYAWISHHEHPFHECLRAVQAIQLGAVPAKIDPLFADQLAELPWVFRDVAALRRQIDSVGLDAMYKRCCDFMLARGSFGDHLSALFKNG